MHPVNMVSRYPNYQSLSDQRRILACPCKITLRSSKDGIMRWNLRWTKRRSTLRATTCEIIELKRRKLLVKDEIARLL